MVAPVLLLVVSSSKLVGKSLKLPETVGSGSAWDASLPPSDTSEASSSIGAAESSVSFNGAFSVSFTGDIVVVKLRWLFQKA